MSRLDDGSGPLNVVFLIADTVRMDFLGFQGGMSRTPALDALAARSSVFTRHYAASFPTVPARYDLHTGRAAFVNVGWGPLPRGHGTVAELMSGRGYSTVGIVDTPFYQINGYNYDRGFRYFYDLRCQPVGWAPRPIGDVAAQTAAYPVPDPITGQLVHRPRTSEADYAAPTTLAMAETCLEYVYRAPFFMLVDTWDPHEPWETPAYYRERYAPGRANPPVGPIYGRWEAQGVTPADLDDARASYAAKLEMVDRWIGRLLDKIERVGIADRTAIIFTTDHGFYFGEHGIFGKMVRETPSAANWLRSPLYEEVARIPLIIHVPGQIPRSVDGLTSALDIAPTILDIAGVQPPPSVQGTSLLPAVQGNPFSGHTSVLTAAPLANVGDAQAVVDDFTRRIAEWQPVTLTTREWSLLYSTPDEPIELFRLADDPHQEHDVSEHNAPVARELVAEIFATHLTASQVDQRLLAPRRPREFPSPHLGQPEGFFDRYDRFQATSTVSATPNRLNKRYQAIIANHRHLFRGARVLDIASHDGRWSFAAIKAGAKHVTGIEARPELVNLANQTFREYGLAEDEYRFVVGDVLERLREEHVPADVVLLLGFLYHVSQHVELVRLIEATGARHVIVDTAIIEDQKVASGAPMVELRREPTSSHANQAFADRRGSTDAIVAYPSRSAVLLLFEYFGFDGIEFDWKTLLSDGIVHDVPDYLLGGRTTFLMTRRDG